MEGEIIGLFDLQQKLTRVTFAGSVSVLFNPFFTIRRQVMFLTDFKN